MIELLAHGAGLHAGVDLHELWLVAAAFGCVAVIVLAAWLIGGGE